VACRGGHARDSLIRSYLAPRRQVSV
jgi:hypothetical protein